MFESAPGEDGCDFSGFKASKEKQIIYDLLAYARVLSNPALKNLAFRMDE